jgi:hypothetical protein
VHSTVSWKDKIYYGINLRTNVLSINEKPDKKIRGSLNILEKSEGLPHKDEPASRKLPWIQTTSLSISCTMIYTYTIGKTIDS